LALTGPMKIFSLIVLAIASQSSPSFAQSCEDDTIQSVSDDGSIIILYSGATYAVHPADQSDTMSWVPADDVLVCNDGELIINKDENGEKAEFSA
jgi:hypothetical protein